MIVVPPGLAGVVCLVLIVCYLALREISAHVSHRADLRSIERLATTSPEHAHLVTDLVAANHSNDLRMVLRRSAPTP